MQNAVTHTETKWQKPRLPLPAGKTKLLGVLSVLIGLAIIATFVLVWTAPAINLNTLFNNSPAPSGNALGVSATDKNNGLAAFERYTQGLADANSPEAFLMLVRSLDQYHSPSERGLVLTALKDASPAVVPVLITALNDSDPRVRAGAAQAVGMRHEYQAIAALSAATRDPDANVRREAITSLGSVGAWEVLPRLEQLQVNDSDYFVRLAALAAKETFKNEIAQAIGVLTPQLRDISITTGAVPQIYAVTTSNLYALHEAATWMLVSRLPDAPLALATGADPALIYLATVSSGLYRSFDAGGTWEYVQFGLQTSTHLAVTAIAVDPQNSRQVYIALATQGTGPGNRIPLGISASKDSGATWWSMENAPTDMVVTRLVLDPQQRGYLFGMTSDSDTPWRYTLP